MPNYGAVRVNGPNGDWEILSEPETGDLIFRELSTGEIRHRLHKNATLAVTREDWPLEMSVEHYLSRWHGRGGKNVDLALTILRNEGAVWPQED